MADICFPTLRAWRVRQRSCSVTRLSLSPRVRGRLGRRLDLYLADTPARGDFLRDAEMEARTHRLRHSYGTNMYDLLRDLVIVQELMRHENISTTRGCVMAPEAETRKIRAFAF